MKLNLVFQDQRGLLQQRLRYWFLCNCNSSFAPVATSGYLFPLHHFIAIFLFFCCRPHDRVPLKDMKADWHSCLDNKVGFKVSSLI